MKTYLLVLLILAPSYIYSYDKGQILSVKKDVRLVYYNKKDLAHWCVGLLAGGNGQIKKIMARADYKFTDIILPELGINTKKVKLNLGPNSSISLRKTNDCNDCVIDLKKGQKVKFLKKSRSSVMKTAGNLGKCGRQHFLELEILDENEEGTGAILTINQYIHYAGTKDVSKYGFLEE